jgi:hypothetical protein
MHRLCQTGGGSARRLCRLYAQPGGMDLAIGQFAAWPFL